MTDAARGAFTEVDHVAELGEVHGWVMESEQDDDMAARVEAAGKHIIKVEAENGRLRAALATALSAMQDAPGLDPGRLYAINKAREALS